GRPDSPPDAPMRGSASHGSSIAGRAKDRRGIRSPAACSIRGLNFNTMGRPQRGRPYPAHQIKHSKHSRRDAMPIYISRGRFTSEAVKGMLAKPENREQAVAKLFQSVGGRLIGWYLDGHW